MSFTILARCLSAICVAIALVWSRDLFQLIGSHGVVDPALALGLSPDFPLSIFHYVAPDTTKVNLAILVVLNTLAISAAVLFWKPRSFWAALILFLDFVCFKQTILLLAYGIFDFLHIGLFYLVLANAFHAAHSAAPMDQWKGERLIGWFARLHLGMAYLFAGLCKGIGPQWWTGESMWRALSRSDSTHQRWFNLSWLGAYPAVLQVMGVSVVFFESLYPLAFVRKLRPFIIGTMISMHVGTIITQGLTLFGLTMVSLNVFFWFESSEWESKTPAPELTPSPAG